MKLKILEDAYKNKTLIGIRTDMIEWDETIIGFITEINELFLTINEIDENGFEIGSTQIAIDDIINIEENDRYQKRLLYLYKNSSEFDVNKRVTFWKTGDELIPYFKELIKNKKILTIYFDEDNFVIGFLLKYDESYIQLNNIGTEGDDDGISYYPLKNVIGLRYNSIEEQKIKLLYENRTSFY